VRCNTDGQAFGVFTLTLTHLLAKMNFSEGMGDVHNTLGNSGGGRHVIFVSRKWKFWGGGGS